METLMRLEVSKDSFRRTAYNAVEFAALLSVYKMH